MAEDFENKEESQDWIFSYADLMSLLLCFFILLFSTAIVDNEKLAAVSRHLQEGFKGIDSQVVPEVQIDKVTKEAQARAFQLLVRMLELGDIDAKMIGSLEKKYKEYKDSDVKKKEFLEDLGEKSQGVMAYLNGVGEEVPPVVSIAIPSKALFKTASAELSEEAKTILDKIAKQISAKGTVQSVEITGHTDSRKLGNHPQYADNWALSSARAASVASELEAAGVERRLLISSGYSSTKPLFPEYDEKGQALITNMAKNRRVEIKVKFSKNDALNE